MKKIHLALLILFLPFLIFAQEKGKPAPEFSGKTAGGETVSLSDFKGKVLVVDFWASWCRPCKEGFPFLIELYDQYSDKDFSVLGINLDEDVKNMTAFIKKLGKEVKFKNISDPDSKIGNLYKVEGIPTTLIIDKNGVVKFITVGYDPGEKEKFKSEIEALLKE
ncbi:MAG: TlpA family protein disulfide reductase [Ignavibacteriae bacterium]|nr:TlpA family protein disulfide reductase [Ignavibacteriota bacterium]